MNECMRAGEMRRRKRRRDLWSFCRRKRGEGAGRAIGVVGVGDHRRRLDA